MLSPFVLHIVINPARSTHEERFHVIGEAWNEARNQPEYAILSERDFCHLMGRDFGHIRKSRSLYSDWLQSGKSFYTTPAQPITLLLAEWYALGEERRATGYAPVVMATWATYSYDHDGNGSYDIFDGIDYPDWNDPAEVERAERYEALTARMKVLRQQMRAMLEVRA